MGVSLFDQLLGTVRGALEGYDLQPSRQLGHEPDCLCRRCAFVRGIRAELAAFEKREAHVWRRAKKRAPEPPLVVPSPSGKGAWVFGATPDPAFHYRAFERAKADELEREGWVRCTAAEARDFWLMGLDETLEKAGLVAMKKRKARFGEKLK